MKIIFILSAIYKACLLTEWWYCLIRDYLVWEPEFESVSAWMLDSEGSGTSGDNTTGSDWLLGSVESVSLSSSISASNSSSVFPSKAANLWASSLSLYFFFDFDFFFRAFCCLYFAIISFRLCPSGDSSSSILSASSSRALRRFCSRDLENWQFKTIPVGICVSWTLLFVLLICKRTC